jgi:hypothetical protein
MNRKVLIILIVVAIAIVATILPLVLRREGEKEIADKRDEAFKNLIEAQERNILSAQGKLIKKNLVASLGGKAGVLIKSESMEIGYLPPPSERIKVFILGTEVEKIEQDAINWLRSRGFSEEDICNMPVVFSIANPDAQVEQTYKLYTNYLPEFCSQILGTE